MTRFGLYLLLFVALPSGIIGYRLGTLKVKPPEVTLERVLVPLGWRARDELERCYSGGVCTLKPEQIVIGGDVGDPIQFTPKEIPPYTCGHRLGEQKPCIGNADHAHGRFGPAVEVWR